MPMGFPDEDIDSRITEGTIGGSDILNSMAVKYFRPPSDDSDAEWNLFKVGGNKGFSEEFGTRTVNLGNSTGFSEPVDSPRLKYIQPNFH